MKKTVKKWQTSKEKTQNCEKSENKVKDSDNSEQLDN